MYTKHKKIFLQNTAIKSLYCSYSQGYLRRTTSLARLLSDAAEFLEIKHDKISLLVLTKKDWQKFVSYRYGVVTQKRTKNSISILAPANYHTQLLHSFDDLILEANKQGLEVRGQIHEFLDILVLLEFIRALLVKNNDKPNEEQAARLFWQSLNYLELDNLALHCNDWARIFELNFEAKLLKISRNKLAIKDKLALYSYHLLKAKTS